MAAPLQARKVPEVRSMAPYGLTAADQVRALPGGGTDEWDLGVREVMLSRFDADGDGWIDAPEVSQVPCDVWRSIDTGVHEGWGTGLYAIYGVAPTALWLGFVLGMDESARPALDAALVQCGAAPAPVAPAPGDAAALDEWVRGLSDGGTGAWDQVVRGGLLATFDRDGDGEIADHGELSGLGCDLWRAMDDGARVRWADGLYRAYGFAEDQRWLGFVLGFSAAIKPAAAAALESCGLVAPIIGFDADLKLARRVRGLNDAGSSGWRADVRQALLEVADVDDSGGLDLRREIEAVGCEAWRAIDRGLRTGEDRGVAALGGIGMVELGLDLASRADLLLALARCDVDLGFARVPQASPPARLLRAMPYPGGSNAWSVGVRHALVQAHDLDGSRRLEQAAEVRAVDCPTWLAMDAAVRGVWPSGLLEVYGFDHAEGFAGVALGIDAEARVAARTSARRCGLR